MSLTAGAILGGLLGMVALSITIGDRTTRGGDFGGCGVDGGRGSLDRVCGGECVEHLSPRVARRSGGGSAEVGGADEVHELNRKRWV